MMPLGSRVVPEDATLEGRIAARLNEALDRQAAADFEAPGERGLADYQSPANCPVCTPRCDAGEFVLRLSVEDVARIAAQEARAWF